MERSVLHRLFYFWRRWFSKFEGFRWCLRCDRSFCCLINFRFRDKLLSIEPNWFEQAPKIQFCKSLLAHYCLFLNIISISGFTFCCMSLTSIIKSIQKTFILFLLNRIHNTKSNIFHLWKQRKIRGTFVYILYIIDWTLFPHIVIFMMQEKI